MDGDYYTNLLKRLWKAIKIKQLGKARNAILFPQDNAPASRSLISMVTRRDCNFELVDYTPLFSWLDLIWLSFVSQQVEKKHSTGTNDDENIPSIDDDDV